MLAVPGADSEGPPRKRRRPALSCVQCRRRKIKCDRNDPCDRCIRSKNAICTYASVAASSVATGHEQEGIENLPCNPGSNPSSAPGEVLPGCRSWDGLNNDSATSGSMTVRSTAPTSHVRRHLWHPPRNYSATQDPDPGQAAGNSVNGVRQQDQTLLDSTSKQPDTIQPVLASPKGARDVRGMMSRGRVFGKSHWINTTREFKEIEAFVHGADMNSTASLQSNAKSSGTLHSLQKCKELTRKAKARASRWLSYQELKNSIPPKEVADHLVDLYLRAFESAYRILHIPSFQNEYARYWNNQEAASEELKLQILLVMAIGTCLYEGPHNQSGLRALALQWIYSAQVWLSGTFEKDRLSISGLQIHCLLLLSRQIHSICCDSIWISAGSLVRTAMQMGLHRDPGHFTKLSVLQTELRRRLWATIMEMAVQSALDSGMPLISPDDFDTEPPSNINDDEMDETTKLLQPKDEGIFTETSFQITLFKSLHTRMEVLRLVNGLKSEPSYVDALHVGSQMAKACRDCSLITRGYGLSSTDQMPRPTAFHRNVVEHFLLRFLLALHVPFTTNARTNPQFYFSRKVALETALTIVTPEDEDDFFRLMSTRGGLFWESFRQCALIIGLELITQVDEDRTNMMLQTNKANREPLKESLKRLLSLSEKRIEMGENSVKSHQFFSMILGQVASMETDIDLELAIANASYTSTRICYDILCARILSNQAAKQPDDLFRSGTVNEQSGYGDALNPGASSLQAIDLRSDMIDSWSFPQWNDKF